ncbi:MAG: FimV/HubP family polar landmark protein, partial [Propionivibrio sp.]
FTYRHRFGDPFADMTAQLASPAAFKQAGLDYATTLLGVNFSVDPRPKGRAVVKLTSDRPINDPFVDMLLQLDWPAGRLIREYTFLLDPPEVAAKAAAPVVPAVAKATPTPQVGSARVVSGPNATIDDELRDRAIARIRAREASGTGGARAVSAAKESTAASAAARPTKGGADGSPTHLVKRGETLHGIATQTKPEGVSLDQMLVGLLRTNQSAFSGGNMNRLQAGRILSIPTKPVIETVSPTEARKIVVAQSSDWNAYQRRLAGLAARAPVAEDAATQESAGKITAKVEDQAAPAAASSDQLKVSKTEAADSKPGAAAAAGSASEEDQIAKEKALREANERVVALEQNVADLQKLLELKNESLAELQKQAVTNPVPAPVVDAGTGTKAPADAVKPPETTLAATPAPDATSKPETAVRPSAADVPAVVPAEVKPAPTPPVEPKPAAPAEPAKPTVPPPPPPPPDEPGFLAGLLEQPMLLGAALLALIAAFLVARRRRAGKEETPLDLGSTLSPQSIGMSGNSVFRSTGGQNVDTSHTPAQTDFSQAGPGSIDTDEVDPVAEADVYMAYGRDAQAEEILLEAKQKDPKRHAIHLKLLEIYSNRKDVKKFEALATELYGETGGVGADWEKAAALGLLLIPASPLFGSLPKAAPVTAGGPSSDSSISPISGADALVPPPSPPVPPAPAAPIEAARVFEATDVRTGAQLPPTADASDTAVAPLAADADALSDSTSLDFDLGQPDEKPVVVLGEVPESVQDVREAATDEALDAGALDFDLGAESVFFSRATEADEPTGADVTNINFPELPTDEGSVTVISAGAPDPDFDRDGATKRPESGKSEASEAQTMIFQPDGADAGSKGDVSESEATQAKESEDSVSADKPGDDVEFDVNLTESTFLGRTMVDTSSFDMSSIDLDLDAPELPAAATPPAASPTDASDELGLRDVPDVPDGTQVSTAVNPDFASEQAETQVNPQIGGESEPDLLPGFDVGANEEVATKLDLAKAYEEMGDFEGARELLDEVVKEGDPAQRDQAQAILARLSE